MRRKALTLIEIVVAVLVVGILTTAGIYFYSSYVERSKSAEAVLNAGVIRKAEEFHKLERGNYVAADNTEQINQLLALDIKPKYYEFQVVGVTDDDFTVIARRIGSEIEMNSWVPENSVITLDKSGTIQAGYGSLSVPGTGPGSSSSGGSMGGGGGGGGGGSGGGGGGGGGGGVGGGGGTGGDSEGGGASSATLTSSQSSVDLDAALDVLRNSTSGLYFYNLIQEKSINVTYEDLGTGLLGLWMPSWWPHVYPPSLYPEYDYPTNNIFIGDSLKSSWSKEAIATVLVHEAVHADYTHNTEKWVLATTDYYGIDRSELNWTTDPVTGEEVLEDSKDQEYNAFKQMAIFWKEVRGAQVNDELDDIANDYDQGASFLMDRVVSLYSTYPNY